MRASVSAILCLLLIAPAAAMAEAAPPRTVSLYWTTEAAVDRLDVAHMGASIRARHRDEEARAIAVWRYVRRTMYHYPMRNENHDDRFDAAKLINVYGYAFCTQQAVTAAAVARAAGLEARVIGVPGHGMYEVFYDGRWHAFCTTAGFYVRTRETDRHVASMDELKADPTLATKAREEGRAGTPFLPCAGGPEILDEPEGSEEVPYALTYRHYDASFFAEAAQEWRDLGPANPSRYQAWIELRPGESLRLDWDASGPFVPPLVAERFHPPRHLCGAKDRLNPFFEEIAPYGRTLRGTTVYRYYGSGEHTWTWKPVLSDAGVLQDLARVENVIVENGSLRPRDPAKPALVEMEMAGPYVYVNGTCTGRTTVGKDGQLAISLQGTDTKAPWRELHTAAAGEGRFRVSLGDLQPTKPVDPKARRSFTRYHFRVRVEITGEAAISDFALRAAVQHSWAALPRLAPGRNTVEVRSRDVTPSLGVTFELAWDEDGRRRTLRRRVNSGRDRYGVELESKSPPRMRHVLFSRGAEERSTRALRGPAP